MGWRNSKKFLIVGAGIGGLTTALALRKFGMECVIFEQSATPHEIGAGLQLSPNAMCAFAALGIDKDILTLAVEPEKCLLRHFRSGRLEMSLPFKGFFEKRYGAKYIHIHRADLHHILTLAAQAAGVQIHRDARVVGYQQSKDSIFAICADGQTHEGTVLIGADGIQSTICAQMHDQTHKQNQIQFTGQMAWRGIIPAEKIAHNTLKEIRNCITNWMGPKQHFIAYFLRQGELINFVAVEERNCWTEKDWQIKGDMADVRAAFADWHAPVQEMLAACDECSLWGLFDRDPLPHWIDGRAVLLGDACHPMLPFMAQGAAMAIEDGYVLAKLVAQENMALGDALQNYQRLRRPRTSMLQKISRKNARLFHLHTPLAQFIRRIIFKLVQYLPWLFAMVLAIYMDKIYKKNVVHNN